MVFTSTYTCVALYIFIGFSFGNASRISLRGEGEYLSQSLDVINDVGGNKIKKAPEYEGNNSSSIFDVRAYGAIGDGIHDDTEAFQAAWTAACEAKNGVMLVPSRYKFLVQTITFHGNKCQTTMTFQVNGEIVAPMKSNWKEVRGHWILFSELKYGLTVTGNGIIDGLGKEWWKDAKSDENSINGDENATGSSRPKGIWIEKSNNVTVKGVTIQNSPNMHLIIGYCQDVNIFDFTVSSPGNSPNTDGIHLTHTQNVKIRNATLACGDDCISIQTGCSNVKIYNVHCGPGHGFSIGSLGYNGPGEEAHVYDIGVYDSTATNTSHGVRIKTWASATGSARQITFDNIIMSNVQNPITVDQHYCDGRDFCDLGASVDGLLSVSGITYNNIRGTYTERAVALVCSERMPCRDINMSNINLRPSSDGVDKQRCSNAYGRVLTKTEPSLDDCILSEASAKASCNGRYGK